MWDCSAGYTVGIAHSKSMNPRLISICLEAYLQLHRFPESATVDLMSTLYLFVTGFSAALSHFLVPDTSSLCGPGPARCFRRRCLYRYTVRRYNCPNIRTRLVCKHQMIPQPMNTRLKFFVIAFLALYGLSAAAALSMDSVKEKLGLVSFSPLQTASGKIVYKQY